MNPEIVFLRGGGLGDFILTLPLIKLAHERGNRVRLYARGSYLKLLGQDWNWLEKREIDELNGSAPPKIKDAMVVSFWTDQKWSQEMLEAGANKAVGLNPRPVEGGSFLVQASEKLGWDLAPNFKTDPILGNYFKSENDTLWVHPGSGASCKNLPLENFISRAYQWLEEQSDRKVFFSFGEADSKVLEMFKANQVCQDHRVNIIQPGTVLNFKNQLLCHAPHYLGNDSGPGHLAANLGLPVEIWFRNTNASVWKPTGPRVVAYDLDSDSSSIL